ncbi:hypothetical protein BN341_11200 [Helicobacter heilmannii ASB1.4]|nr:hypothetical protein BN341_11200 [Helicobacter heilmannii ASB1.4]
MGRADNLHLVKGPSPYPNVRKAKGGWWRTTWHFCLALGR